MQSNTKYMSECIQYSLMTIKCCISSHLMPVCVQEGTTPLILAAANNHIECVRELLKNGADGGARRLVRLLFIKQLYTHKLSSIQFIMNKQN